MTLIINIFLNGSEIKSGSEIFLLNIFAHSYHNDEHLFDISKPTLIPKPFKDTLYRIHTGNNIHFRIFRDVYLLGTLSIV